MLDSPVPKFCMGQRVSWSGQRRGKTGREYGVIMGMKYTSPLHRVISRGNFKVENIGWWYEVSMVEGRSLEDLAQNWEGGHPLTEVPEAELETVDPLTNAAPLDEIRHTMAAE